MHSNLNRRGFLALTGGAGLAAFLSACGGSGSGTGTGSGSSVGSSTASTPKLDPATEPDGPIKVFTWAGYDDAPKDGSPWMWADYEASPYGKTSPLEFAFLEDDAQALSKVAAGYSPDIVHPCIGWVLRWKEAGLIQPIDTSLLPDWDGIPEDIRKGAMIDGQVYYMPFDVGFSSLTYDADAIELPDGKESWKLLLDDRYKGKMSFFSDPTAIISASFLMNEGAKDPNVMSDAQIAAAKETSLQWKANLRNYWTSQADTVNDFVNGNLLATYTWPDGYWRIKNHPKMKGRNIKFMWPDEGRFAWICGMVVTATAKAPGRAMLAMASANTPAAGAALTDYYQYSSAQQKDVASLIKDRALVKAFSIDDPSAWKAPRTWFEAPMANQTAVMQAGEEVKAA